VSVQDAETRSAASASLMHNSQSAMRDNLKAEDGELASNA
jgi:hypothetical protein